MKNKVRSIAIVTFLSALTVGCEKEPPKCSDEDTFTLVRQIIVDQRGGRKAATDKELHKAFQDSIKIELPRASAFDEKIKRFSCEAKLIVGGSPELPITYESQLDDRNQHIVSVGEMSRGNQIAIEVAFVKVFMKNRAAQEGAASPAAE